MVTATLGSRYEHVLDRIFQHPASHNLEWSDVVSLINHLGTVEHLDNGRLRFSVNGVSQTFHPDRDKKDVSEIQEVLGIRHFLESAGIGKDGPLAPEATLVTSRLRMLVVINRLETQIFLSEVKGSVSELVRPYDPHGVLQHVKYVNGMDFDARNLENIAYHQAIAEKLVGADEVLLIGNGTGTSSAMLQAKNYLVKYDPNIAKRIVGSLTLDVEALTTAQILKEARTFFVARDGIA